MICAGLKETFREGYDRGKLITDIQAGIVVAIVALPLSMALAIASGVAPQNGLYTAFIGGALIALLGGSRVQVSGPTAAFVVLLLPVVQKFGLSGLLTAGFIAGLILLAMGLMRWGEIIQYVPHPVTTGFTTGIALVIATLQFKDFFGLQMSNPSDFMERMKVIFESLLTLDWRELMLSSITLVILFKAHAWTKKVPAPIIALTAITALDLLLEKFLPGWSAATINNRFHYIYNGQTYPGVPQTIPMLMWPWMAGGETHLLNWAYIRDLFPSAFAIAMLGAIESLLSAVVADGMIQKRHDPNNELTALGIGNIIAPFFGGIAATGAIARTTTNVRFGARSPIAAFTHAIVIFLILVLFAPFVGYIPMSALASLLLFVAWNMAERHNFANILRMGTREDKMVLTACFSLTVIFDMTVGVGVGMVLASVLFIHRMSRLAEGKILTVVEEGDADEPLQIPDSVFYYRISGALFFGAAQRAFHRVAIPPKAANVILDISRVQVMDVTGMVALSTVLKDILVQKKTVYIIVQAPNVLEKLNRLDIFRDNKGKAIIVEKSVQQLLPRLIPHSPAI